MATDARRKEVYWARYDADGVRLEGPAVGSAASIPGAAGLAVAGSGGQLYPEAFGAVTGPAYPDARTLCALAVVSAIGVGMLGLSRLLPARRSGRQVDNECVRAAWRRPRRQDPRVAEG